MFQNIGKILGKPVSREEQEELFKKEALHILEKEIKTKVPASFHEHSFKEGWPDVANFIKEILDKKGQEEFIKRLLKKGKYKNIDELAKFLTHVNGIPWFKPFSKPDQETIKSLVNDCIKSLDLNSREQDGGKWTHFEIQEIKIMEDTWNEANEASRNLLVEPTNNSISRNLTELTRKNNQEENINSLNSLIWGMIWGQSEIGGSNSPILSASGTVQDIVKWICFNDLKDNPFKSLLELYELGLWPIGIDDKHNFIVF